MTSDGSEAGDDKRHDKADKGADDDVDFPHFKFDVLPYFRADRIQRLDDDVFRAGTSATGHAVRMAADLYFGKAVFFNR